MFLQLITYPSSSAEREPFLDEHHEYLDRQYRSGRYVLWGAASGSRGLILVCCEDRAEVESLVAGDPFVREGLVECELIEIDVSRSAIELFRAG